MQRNLLIALSVAIVVTWCYLVAPAPMRCDPQGCLADIAERFSARPPVDHIVRFLFTFGGFFALIHWFAPWSGRVRRRARMRLWHGYRDE